MRREAFKMYLKPGSEAEYERRYAALWPEMKTFLQEGGVSDYSIFLDRETSVLYAVLKVEGEEDTQELGAHPVLRKWWEHMADIMITNPDHSPVAVPLLEMFHLD